MMNKKCGEQCGLDDDLGTGCVPCEMHGFCHMCEVEGYNKKISELKISRYKYIKEVCSFKQGVAYVALMKRIDELEQYLADEYGDKLA